MPRLSLDQRKKLANNIVIAISGELAKQRMIRKDLAKKALISQSTLSNRMKSPEDFTIDELLRISNVLNTTIDNLIHGKISGICTLNDK